MSNILSIRNLHCGYDAGEVLSGISLDVPEGCFLGIIGPNGAGKTTLFRAMTKIVKPSLGSILFKGRDLVTLTRRQLAREVAVLPQILEMPFSFTVEEFVTMGRFPHVGRFEGFSARDLTAVEGAMERADVARLRERSVKQLSSGEIQRVLLAQALAQEPKLLLLDEPVSHLDIKHQVEILDMLKELNASGLSVIIILHDLNLASEYCDTLLLLDRGAVHTYGETAEVLKYDVLEEVYKTVVVVEKNPISGKPFVFLVSKAAAAAVCSAVSREAEK